MNLYFFRHALAQDHDLSISDYERALVPKGIARTEQAAQALKALDLKLDALYSSPLVRARQTAEIIARALNMTVKLSEALSPGFDVRAAERLIAHHRNGGDVMFVGHEPGFSLTIQAITGARVVMKKGGMARIEVTQYEPLQGELAWLIAPSIFDRIES